MEKSLKPLFLFNLPDWARWHAWVELSANLKIQILSLKFPRWDASFYPIFLNQNNEPFYALPDDLSLVAKDGRLWYCCPEEIYFSKASSRVIIDNLIEGDHPLPQIAERQIISMPDFIAKTAESHRGDYEKDGGTIPRLSKLSEDFKSQKVYFFNQAPARISAPTPWGIEKPKKKRS